MTDKHPTDALQMPEPVDYGYREGETWVQQLCYTADQLRAERIAAYNLGRESMREETLAEAETGIWFDKMGSEIADSIADAIRSIEL